MTWDGQVPGPMIRVRQDDTITLTVKSAKENTWPYNLEWWPRAGARRSDSNASIREYSFTIAPCRRWMSTSAAACSA